MRASIASSQDVLAKEADRSRWMLDIDAVH